MRSRASEDIGVGILRATRLGAISRRARAEVLRPPAVAAAASPFIPRARRAVALVSDDSDLVRRPQARPRAYFGTTIDQAAAPATSSSKRAAARAGVTLRIAATASASVVSLSAVPSSRLAARSGELNVRR